MTFTRELLAKAARRETRETTAAANRAATAARHAAGRGVKQAGRGVAATARAGGRAATAVGQTTGRGAQTAARRLAAATTGAAAALAGAPTSSEFVDRIYTAQQGRCAGCGVFALRRDLRVGQPDEINTQWVLLCGGCVR